MSTAVGVVVGVVVAIGLTEMVLTAIGTLLGLSSWTRRYTELTHVAPSTAVRMAFGTVAALAAVTLGVGYAHPGWWVVGGILLMGLAGPILVRQLVIGTRGTALIAYSLFTACGAVALVAGVNAT
ncbi:hypothetical protein [uncultured Williamsia sp.]|uniref:hypothetical protein n=1 Tax=uncultured Williamsia sp. TaxID=259311 RepID=UPI00262E2F0A|nr:hypothetical protein [uncultured Williamsia sp.]